MAYSELPWSHFFGIRRGELNYTKKRFLLRLQTCFISVTFFYFWTFFTSMVWCAVEMDQRTCVGSLSKHALPTTSELVRALHEDCSFAQCRALKQTSPVISPLCRTSRRRSAAFCAVPFLNDACSDAITDIKLLGCVDGAGLFKREHFWDLLGDFARPSVLWCSWLGGRKGIRPVKNFEWWGAGVVICLERSADLNMAQLMPLPLTVSCFSKIQIGFTFLVPAHLGSPGKRAVKRMCVSK